MTNQQRKINTSTSQSGCMISRFSSKKKSRYNLSKLYMELSLSMRKLNRENICHLTTYPYIAVHVQNRDSVYLEKNQELIRNAIESALFEMQE